MPHADQGAWEIPRTFASSEMTLPKAEECLKKQLGNQYIMHDWKSALDAVMNVEGDIVQAQEALHKLASECQLPCLTIKLPRKSLPESAAIPQITNISKIKGLLNLLNLLNAQLRRISKLSIYFFLKISGVLSRSKNLSSLRRFRRYLSKLLPTYY